MKWDLMRGKKPSAIAIAAPSAIASIVIMTFVVTVVVLLTATGYTMAAIRRRRRRKQALSDRYMLAERYSDFNSHSAKLEDACSEELRE